MKKLLRNNLWMIGAVLGAVSGLLYWKYTGCISGTCTITSKPLNSMVYFSIISGLLFSMVEPKKKLPAKDVSANKDVL
jgi:phage shock protein E